MPLPTDVGPTMKPPTIPIATATIRSRVLSRPRVDADPPRCVNALATKATAPKACTRAPALRIDAVSVAVGQVRRAPLQRGTPGRSGEHPEGEPGSDRPQAPMLNRTKDLKIAPWRMSVPIADAGLKLKKMRIGS